MPDTPFPGRLRELRQAAGLTQQQLADRAGLHRVHVAHLETGGRRPDRLNLDTARRLADALGVGLEALLSGPDGSAKNSEKSR